MFVARSKLARMARYHVPLCSVRQVILMIRFSLRSSRNSRYFNLSEAFAMPAFAHAASLSPQGAPLTATAPIVDSPTFIGTPPCALIVPGIVAGGAACPGGGGCAGPEGRL